MEFPSLSHIEVFDLKTRDSLYSFLTDVGWLRITPIVQVDDESSNLFEDIKKLPPTPKVLIFEF